jgi:ribosomal-protein-alanine N-acetyltransferase
MDSREFETSRLRFQPFRREDLDDLHRLFTEPQVRRYLWDDRLITREKAAEVIELSIESFEQNRYGLWCLFLRDSNAGLIGFAGLRQFGDPPEVEILYGIAPSHWNRGLATEAAAAMLDYGFRQAGLDTLYARADTPNTASIKVMQKCEMAFFDRGLVNGLDTVTYIASRSDNL